MPMSRITSVKLLCTMVQAAGRLCMHDEFLLAEQCKFVTVSDVLKYLAADKCNEWMNKWMKKWKLRRISFKPMFLLSLLTNKDSYNTQIIQCVNHTIFRKRFRVPGFGTGSGGLLSVSAIYISCPRPIFVQTVQAALIKRVHFGRHNSNNIHCTCLMRRFLGVA